MTIVCCQLSTEPNTNNKLISREILMEELLSRLEKSESLLLLAPRGMGKTSILLALREKLKNKGSQTTYANLPQIDTLKELEQKLCGKEIEGEIFDFLAENTFSQSRVYCFLDGIDELKAIDFSLLQNLKKHLLSKQIIFIFSAISEYSLKEFLDEKSLPFFHSIRLPTIVMETFSKEVRTEFEKRDLQIDPEISLKLCRWLEMNPTHIWMLMEQIVVLARSKRLTSIDMPLLREGFLRTLTQMQTELDLLWNQLGKVSRVTRRICAHIACHGSKTLFSKEGLKKNIDSAQIAQSLRSLEEKGILIKEEKGIYRFPNRFFVEYIRGLKNRDYLNQWENPFDYNS